MELMVACQGIDMRGNKGLGKGTQAAYDLVRSKVATLTKTENCMGISTTAKRSLKTDL